MPVFVSDLFFQSDTHYSILSLLFNLADSPTAFDYEEVKRQRERGKPNIQRFQNVF